MSVADDQAFADGIVRTGKAAKLQKPAQWAAMEQWAKTVPEHPLVHAFFDNMETMDAQKLAPELKDAIATEAPAHLAEDLEDLLGEVEAAEGNLICI